MPIVSLADLRAHLNWPSSKGTEDDDELEALAASCEDIIESYLGRPARTAQVAETHYGGKNALLLQRTPCPCTTCSAYRVLTITSVVEDGAALDSTQWTLDSASGLLYRGTTIAQAWTSITPAAIVVTYSAGYSTPPPWLTMAVKRLVEHLWTKSQQARHGRSSAMESGVPTYLLPYMVQSILNPHRDPGW